MFKLSFLCLTCSPPPSFDAANDDNSTISSSSSSSSTCFPDGVVVSGEVTVTISNDLDRVGDRLDVLLPPRVLPVLELLFPTLLLELVSLVSLVDKDDNERNEEGFPEAFCPFFPPPAAVLDVDEALLLCPDEFFRNNKDDVGEGDRDEGRDLLGDDCLLDDGADGADEDFSGTVTSLISW